MTIKAIVFVESRQRMKREYHTKSTYSDRVATKSLQSSTVRPVTVMKKKNKYRGRLYIITEPDARDDTANDKSH